ncbi:PIN domain-containing protein [Thalassospira sp.]|uniref:PIN domain-containing protein n=1 Tax=Thalassospira sp. TaxID=1912094 RepID=UPI001B18BB7A|nr:PIN domain-containing protein [Thalassospira sp.]MBO6808830.1 PIN domain-containing protein [Thalassospira sp.]MBO6840779.1 PIN domain-containing protein [Thalassospira sp.]
MTYRADHFTALLDACVLADAFKRNLLLSLARAELFRPRWSPQILDETERAILKITKGEADGTKQRAAIERAFRDACVTGYDAPISAVSLPDPDDRHVLAAAIHTNAQVLVTDNLKDFPPSELAKFGVELKSPDEFIADTITLHEQTAFGALKAMRVRYQNPALTTDKIIQFAESRGLMTTALLLKEYEQYW